MDFQKGDTYILGIDVGVASLGLSAITLDNKFHQMEPIDGAVLLYPIPEGATERREKRSARKNNDRQQQRLDRIEHIFTDCKVGMPRAGLPKAYKDKSPYTLRAKASRQEIDLIELQIVLMNMAKHRGSSAIREQDIGDEKEQRQTANGIKKLRRELELLNFDTYGQYLRYREKKNLPIRLNPNKRKIMDKDGYVFYPSRTLLMEEFDCIWEKQSSYHKDVLTPQLKHELRSELFFQRPITPPPPGSCPFFSDEEKLHKNTLLFQKRRIYEDLNHLRFFDKLGEPLDYTLQQRDHLAKIALSGVDLGLKVIKQELGHTNTVKISLEDIPSKQKKITAYPYAEISEDEEVLKVWKTLSEQNQQTLLDILNQTYDDLACQEKIMDFLKCDAALAEKFMQLPLPTGYGHAGQTASEKLLEALKQDLIPARKAQDKAGLIHGMEADGVVYDYLPYYGEILRSHVMKPIWVHGSKRPTNQPPATNPNEAKYGRIPNPVVHLALNQIRKAVNAMIRKYGKPQYIHIELSRELNKSAEDRERIAKQQNDNKIENEKIREEIKKLDLKPTRLRLQRYKLWKEQGGVCIYSDKTIQITDLYGGEVDVDHILPRSKTFSDSMMNKVVCWHHENHQKSNQSPYEAFHEDEDKWAGILRRVEKLPPAKQWRFQATAMENFETDPESFRTRYGNDNSYLARVARLYLGSLYGETTPVIAVSSYITSLLRGKWGMQKILGSKENEKKSRDDHRHHFIDAFVVACTTRQMVQKIQHEAARCEAAGYEEFVKTITPPGDEDPDAFFSRMHNFTFDKVKITRKPDHSPLGQLHEDTLLGIVDPTPNKDGRFLVVKRKTVADYDTHDDLEKVKILDNLPDHPRIVTARKKLETLKETLKSLEPQATAILEEQNDQLVASGKKPKKITPKALYTKCCELLSDQKMSDHIEVFSQESLVNVRLSPENNQPTGGYISGRNHHVDFYVDAKGKIQWQLASMMEVNDPDFVPEAQKTGNFLLWPLHKDDMVRLKNPENEDEILEYRVTKFSQGKLNLVPLYDARDSKKRDEIKEKGLSFYCTHNLQPIVKNAIGDVVWVKPALSPTGKMDIS